MATTQAETVDNANGELKALLADLRGHRENAFVIRLTEILVKLTGDEEDAKAIEDAHKPDPIEAQRQALRDKAAELLKAANTLT